MLTDFRYGLTKRVTRHPNGRNSYGYLWDVSFNPFSDAGTAEIFGPGTKNELETFRPKRRILMYYNYSSLFYTNKLSGIVCVKTIKY